MSDKKNANIFINNSFTEIYNDTKIIKDTGFGLKYYFLPKTVLKFKNDNI